MSLRLNNNQICDLAYDFEKTLREANAKGNAIAFLKDHNFNTDDLDECDYNKKTVRLLIVGDSVLNKDDMCRILKRYGIDVKRVDFMLDYNKAKNYRWGQIQYQFTYSDIIFGPLGHSASGKGDSSSLLTEMESGDGWPNIVRASANNGLKITKESFERAIVQTEFYNKGLSSYN